MNHALSRRVARALHALADNPMPLGDRIAAAAATEQAATFEDLPASVRALVLRGERRRR